MSKKKQNALLRRAVPFFMTLAVCAVPALSSLPSSGTLEASATNNSNVVEIETPNLTNKDVQQAESDVVVETYIRENMNKKYGTVGQMKTANILVVKQTLVDKSMVTDDLNSIDSIMYDILETGDMIVGQFQTNVMVYDVDVDSDYLVAYANTMHKDNNSTVLEVQSAYATNTGETVDGVIYDEATGLMYIPRDLYVVGGDSVFGLLQTQLLQSVEFGTSEDLVSASITVTTEDDKLKDVTADVSNIFESATVTTQTGLTADELIVSVNGVPVEEFDYDKKTGEITLNESAATIGTVNVEIADEATVASVLASFAPMKASAITPSQMVSIGKTTIPEKSDVGDSWNTTSLKIRTLGSDMPANHYSYWYGLASANVADMIKSIDTATISYEDAVARGELSAFATHMYSVTDLSTNPFVGLDFSETLITETNPVVLAGTTLSNSLGADVTGTNGNWTEANGKVRLLHKWVDADGKTYGVMGIITQKLHGQVGIALIRTELEPDVGHLSLTKVSDNPAIVNSLIGYSIQGAEFNVYDETNTLVGSITTDATGKGNLDDLLPGAYTIRETKASAGHLLAEDTRVQIVAGVRQNVTITEPSAFDTGDASIKKQDAFGNPVANGDASLENAEFTVKFYDAIEDVTSAPATRTTTIRPATRTWVYKTNADGVIDFYDEDCLISDRSSVLFRDANGEIIFPVGGYIIEETQAPYGYLLNEDAKTMYIVEVSDDFTSVIGSEEFLVNQTVITGTVNIEKWDTESDSNEAQGDATFEGIEVQIINKSKNSVTLADGKTTEVGEVVKTLTFDANGKASLEGLPVGTYEVVEVTANDSYLPEGKLSQTFSITAEAGDGQVVNLTDTDTAIKNDVVRGGVTIAKWDIETNSDTALGGATLEGAEIQIINRSAKSVLVEGEWYANGEVVKTIITDETGKFTTDADLLPYGTYELLEITAPEGYLLEGELSKTFEIREDGVIVDMDTDEGAIKNQVKRGDLELVKIADTTHERLAGVLFEITSLTTGESHIIVTDANGEAKTQSAWNLHSNNTNRGEKDTDGVWFGLNGDGENVTVNNDFGALPYDTYTVTELECDANEDYKLVPPITITITRDNTVVHMGTITNDLDVIGMSTMFVDPTTQEHETTVSGSSTLVDYVDLQGLTVGRVYELQAIVMDKETGEALIINGETVTNVVRFTADAETMTVEVPFTFNSSEMQEQSVVAFEKLFWVRSEDRIIERTTHEDINDLGQTVTFKAVTIESDLLSGVTNTHNTVASGTQTITDYVKMTGLTVGDTYEIDSVLYLQDGEELTQIDADNNHTMTFVADAEDMVVEVKYEFDTTPYANTTIVSYNTVSIIVVNEDTIELTTNVGTEIVNNYVTIGEISIVTTALDVVTGGREAQVSGKSKIVDTVELTDLIVGKTYTLVGTPNRLSDGKALLNDEGEVMTSVVEFVAEAENMVVLVPFTVDTTSFRDDAIVIFEELYDNDNMVTPCASHTNLEDKQQTVEYSPVGVRTQASDALTNVNNGHAINTSINDVVAMEGLVIGDEYTAVAVLMNPETNEPLQVPTTVVNENADVITSDIETVETDEELVLSTYDKFVASLGEPKEGMMFVTGYTTFVAEETSQDVVVSLDIDASELAGQSVVVFEYLFDAYNTDVTIGEHVDIKDEAQTIMYNVTQIGTKAINATNGKKYVVRGETFVLEDTISYKGLIPGNEYTFVGLVMDKATNAPTKNANGDYITSTAVHTPTSPNGEVIVSFEIDTTNMTDTTLVVFECAYLGDPSVEGNTPVATHEDINDKGQSIDVISPEVEKEIVKTGQMQTIGFALALLATASTAGIVMFKRRRRKD